MKKIIFLFFVFATITLNAQTAEELKSTLKSKKDSIAKLQKKAKAIQAKIDALPGWKCGAFGTVGANFSGFNNWYSKDAQNSAAANVGITVNAFANLIEDKFFWRNAMNINVGWVKFDDKDDPNDDPSFETATDVFNISSLYGRKLNQKWALSALGEYRTTLIDNFNDPGYLDLGVGFTWTPINNLVVVINPGNYNFVFSDGDTVFESSLGAKILADYTAKIGKVNLKSNLSLFQSYKSSDFSNWTFTNAISYTLWNGIGVGAELGLRSNKQEALNAALADNPAETFDSVDNKLQSYYLIGLSYNF